MYIDDDVILRLAGLESHDLYGTPCRELNSGQTALLAAFYVGKKLEALDARVLELIETLRKYDAHDVVEAIKELSQTWRNT